MKVLLNNKKARYNYEIISTLEAGLVLLGDEVKSLRMGQGKIEEAFATFQKGECFLNNLYIAPYKHATMQGQRDPKRPRKLLLHSRQIHKLSGAVSYQGLALVPTKLYITPKGKIKAELALSKGKTKADKRETLKEKSWQRQKQHLLKKKCLS